MIRYASRPLVVAGYGSLLALVPLLAQDPTAAVPADAATPADASTPGVPVDPTRPDPTDTSRAQVPTIYQDPANPQPTNIPLFPAAPGNPVSPYTSSSANPQSPEITSPTLYVTGTRDVSQVATSNALSQAFSQQGADSSFYGDTGADHEHAPIERIRLGPVDLKAAVVMGVVGDDNVRNGGGANQQQGKKSDIEFGVTPAILLAYGNHEGQRGLVTLVYAPTITRFYHESNQNTENQNVALNAIYPLQRLTLNLTQTYTQTTGVNSDSNQRTTQSSTLSGIGATYEVDDKISVSSQLQEAITEFSNPGNNNGGNGGNNGTGNGGQGQTTTTINNNATYRLSEKLTVGPSVNIGWDRPKNSTKSTYEQGLVGLNYTPTEKIGLYAQGGAEIRQYDGGGGTKINPVFSIGAGYTPFDSTTLAVNASQSVHSSTAEVGQPTASQTVVTTTVGAAVTQRVLQRFYLGFAFSYGHEDDQAAGNNGPTTGGTNGNGNGSEDNFNYRGSVTYAPTTWTSVAFYYQYLANESNVQGQSYNDNQVGITVSAQF